MKKTSEYIHTEEFHNLNSPREIVPTLIELFKPKSVVDFGCGLGTFLYCFKERGIDDILGIEGAWVKKELIEKYLAPDEYIINDLEQPISLQKRFDISICLEVAEHLSESASETLLNNLCNSSNIIVFSAAIPYQGGLNHINEKWMTYWEEKFKDKGYLLIDILRPRFWTNPNIFVWYKQNIVIFIDSKIKDNFNFTDVNWPINLVHPDCYLPKARRLDTLLKGEDELYIYVKLLIKKFLNKFNLS